MFEVERVGVGEEKESARAGRHDLWGRIKRYRKRLIPYARNLYNGTRYGRMAPKADEIVWVLPQRELRALHPAAVERMCGLPIRQASGFVVASRWPDDAAFVIQGPPPAPSWRDESKDLLSWEETVKLRFHFSVEHWVRGVPWGETGALDLMEERLRLNRSVDSCRNMHDARRRYEILDSVFEQVKREGRMRLKSGADPGKRWGGYEGIMHIGPGGEPFFGGFSNHRLAMAFILQVPYPARIGCVHVSAIPLLHEFRKASKSRPGGNG